MKKLIAASILAVTVALAGCATPGGSLDEKDATPAPPRTIDNGGTWENLADKLYVETVTLPDGRLITCVVLSNSAKDYSYGGVSCDWDTANGVFEEPR